MRRGAHWLGGLALACATLALAQGPQAGGVNLFPIQNWASLREETKPVVPLADAAPELAAPLPEAPSEAAPAPFSAVGEWRQDGQRVVVLEGLGRSFLLCAGCRMPKALQPGAKLAEQYTFKAVEAERVLLLDTEGREHSIPLHPLAN
ncbi:hypothetical protein [Chromobacterium haemolyticum]|uniref:hypothetical protein n=1 Tax=Chromobacterium haemolyticum TaxID=394935 RepID=UPI0009DA1529|nr:hypothetical protein [Chromobacterium haemolyticum]OQS37978.1 hypothetical protein B0T40_07620 [Chromobacterium haemolyticum]PTU68689.1 hypothetical protein DBB33_04135 [Chromobacterium haemolyticum]